MGGLIACSILSGRIMGPVVGIPNHLVQWAHTKAALKALDQLWDLEDDHAGQSHPIILDHVHGHYRIQDMTAYYGEIPALKIPHCEIKAGEKIAVLGSVGSGKTTLLRLLSGMYKPREGQIFLDDVDLSAISKPILAEHMGFVQQEGRLFAGTLRENITLGMIDPGDERILEVSRMTGLLEMVISPHPQGLQQEIFEGGTSLSGGQRQLINLTRAFLRQPSIWLLDEPTASMDRKLEKKIILALHEQLSQQDTMILVTHKMEMVQLVERIIVIAKGTIAMDGPRDQVLNQLRSAQDKKEVEKQTA
jgi:ATP-binding cassette subfamily C protein LapB